MTVLIFAVSLSAFRDTAICTANLVRDVMQIDLNENTNVIECRRYSDFQVRVFFHIQLD